MSITSNQFLVCGLGGLGQQCVLALKEFGAIVYAIEEKSQNTWDVPELTNLLDRLIIGNCTEAKVLEEAGVRECRSILLTTNSERVNLEAALVARLINPEIRLILRSAKENLNLLLNQQLGNYIAFEPSQLPASAFALAALGDETLGFFLIDDWRLRVVQTQITRGDKWYDRYVYEIDSRNRRLISYQSSQLLLQSLTFYEWNTELKLQHGDRIIYLEQEPGRSLKSTQNSGYERGNLQHLWSAIKTINFQKIQQKKQDLWAWINETTIRRLILFVSIILLTVILVNTSVFYLYYPEITLDQSIFVTATLLLGGFGDIFGNIDPHIKISWWLKLLSLGVAITGTFLIGLIYGLITEKLLSIKFALKPRSAVPQQDHIIVIGLGRLGQGITNILWQFRQNIVALSNHEMITDIPPQVCTVTGNMFKSIQQVNLPKAKSVIVVTDDDMFNLEIGLTVRRINPTINLVIRTMQSKFSKTLASLMPDTQILAIYELAAEAFAGAAFGENILSLFRIGRKNILVTEYAIEAGDTLNGLMLSDIAYGYEVVPIWHRKLDQEGRLMPSDAIRLHIGDRLIILADIHGLQRIEKGRLAEKKWQVKVEEALSADAAFQGANEISNLTGCSISIARELMQNLPAIVPEKLYRHQAQNLVRVLRKNQVTAKCL